MLGLYQRILAGRVVIKEPALGTFTWDELSIAVQDQVVALMNAVNRAQDKVQYTLKIVIFKRV